MACKLDLNLVFRICNIIIGVLLLALGIVRFAYANELSFIQVLLTVYYILFAVIYVLSEFEIPFIINLFNFLTTVYGKGFFLIFVGVLCFDIVGSVKRPYEKMDLAVGIITLVYAIVLIVLGCMFKEGDTAPTSSEPKKISPGQV